MFFNGTIIFIHQNERNLPIPTVIYIIQEILCYFPLIFSVLGFIGFLGNVLMFIQHELRSNSCCIYIFCSSMTDFIHLMINVFPEYLQVRHGYSLPWSQNVNLCKLIFFLSNFLPHLAISFLILSIIDRFVSTCSLQAFIHRFNQSALLLSIISITIFISIVASLYGPILGYYEIYGCTYEQPKLYAMLNILFNGIIPPIVMLTFALLTYRNVHLIRRRVVS